MLGAHPHGIMSTGTFCNFSTDSNDFCQLFPGLRPWVATLVGLFYLPIYRDYLMFIGEPSYPSLVSTWHSLDQVGLWLHLWGTVILIVS